MDQGFAEQGFLGTPSASTVEEAGVAAREAIEKARGHVPYSAPQGFSSSGSGTMGYSTTAPLSNSIQGMRPTVLETAAKGTVSAIHKDWEAKNLDPTQQEVVRLQSIKATFMMPANIEIVGMLGGGALGWVTTKLGWQRATAAIGMALKAPVQALRETSLAQLFRMPSNFFKEASREAANAGDKAAGWAEASTRRSEAFAKTAETMEARTASFVAPLRRTVGNGITSFESTSAGKGLHGVFDRLMHSRKAAVIAKHDDVFAKAQTALTTQASAGWKESIGNFFKHTVMHKPLPTVDAGELSHMMHGLNSAKGNPAELKSLAGQLEALVSNESLTAEARARAGNVAKHVGKLIGSAQAMETYSSATSGSMKTMVKAMGKAVARIPVFNALLAVGITAGVGATLVAAKAESKQAKEAFADLSNQLGNTNSGFLHAVKNAQKSQGVLGKVKTGVKLVGDVADGAMWMLPGGGGMAMMGAVMIPQLCESLVADNALLGAYVALQKNERGELKLAPDGKIEAIRHLVAAMPAVAAKGGYYNHLSQPIAAEMVSRNLNTQQIVQLFGNESAFTALASEVAAKRDEHAKTPTTEASKSDVSAVNDNAGAGVTAKADGHAHPAAVQAQAAMNSAENAHTLTDTPSLKIAANDAALDGKVTAQHRHMG